MCLARPLPGPGGWGGWGAGGEGGEPCAFAWACWQGHVSTARWLAERGNCAFGAVNTFGCNAAMWCVQGRAAGLDACEYVKSLGVSFRLLNANGHSAAHKAAQRGRRDVCAWLLGWEWPEGRDAPAPRDEVAGRESKTDPLARALVDAAHLGPDDEGFRPSDLARLAGDVRLRDFLEARQHEWDAETDERDETNEGDEIERRSRALGARVGRRRRRVLGAALLSAIYTLLLCIELSAVYTLLLRGERFEILDFASEFLVLFLYAGRHVSRLRLAVASSSRPRFSPASAPVLSVSLSSRPLSFQFHDFTGGRSVGGLESRRHDMALYLVALIS